MKNELRIELVLFGPMQVVLHHADGASERIEIKSAKARGLLALIAVAPSQSRSRNWLRDMLWSDRERVQASASLRQELANLLRLHPDFAQIIKKDRKTVWLDTKRLLGDPTERPRDAGAFLEDVDVQDPAFAAWLMAERADRDQSPSAMPMPFLSQHTTQDKRRVLAFRTSTPSQDPNSFLETTLSHFIGQSLNEHIMVDVIDAGAARAVPSATWIEIHAVPRDDQTSVVRISVRDGPRRLLIWSDLQSLPSDMLLDFNNAALLSYCHQIVCGILDALVLRQPDNPDDVETGMIAHLASRKVFSMDAEEMQVSDKLFSLANGRGPRGVYLAWQALLRSFQIIERHDLDAAQLAEEGERLCAEALAMEPNNSMVLALVSNARLALGGDPEPCRRLAEDSVRLNPANPFSWDSLSIVRLYQKDYAGAHDLAVRAQQVSEGTPFRFWWDAGRAISAATVGRLSEAITYAERSQSQSPTFHPPKRYLIGLYSALGREDKVAKAVANLRQYEPDFAPIQLLDDPEYPSSLLVKGGLFDRSMLERFS